MATSKASGKKSGSGDESDEFRLIDPLDGYLLARLAQKPASEGGSDELIGLIKDNGIKKIARGLVELKHGKTPKEKQVAKDAGRILEWVRANRYK
jgi:hypothetical protein